MDFSNLKVKNTCSSLIQVSLGQLYDGKGSLLPLTFTSGVITAPRLEAPNTIPIMPVMLSGTQTGITNQGIQVDGNLVRPSTSVLAVPPSGAWQTGQLAFVKPTGLTKTSGLIAHPLAIGNAQISDIYPSTFFSAYLPISDGKWLSIVVLQRDSSYPWAQSPPTISNGLAVGSPGQARIPPQVQLKLWSPTGSLLAEQSTDIPKLDSFRRIELSLYGGIRNSIGYYYVNENTAYAHSYNQPVCNFPPRTSETGLQTTINGFWTGSRGEMAQFMGNSFWITPMGTDEWALFFKQDSINYAPICTIGFSVQPLTSTIAISKSPLTKGKFGFGCLSQAPVVQVIEDSFGWGEYLPTLSRFRELPDRSLSGGVIGFAKATANSVICLTFDKYQNALITRISTLNGTSSGYLANLPTKQWFENKPVPKVKFYPQASAPHFVVWEAPDGLRMASIGADGQTISQRLVSSNTTNWAFQLIGAIPVLTQWGKESTSINVFSGFTGAIDETQLVIEGITDSPIIGLVAGQNNQIMALHSKTDYVSIYTMATASSVSDAKLMWSQDIKAFSPNIEFTDSSLVAFGPLNTNKLVELPTAPAQPCGVAIDFQALALSGKVAELESNALWWGTQIGNLGYLV